MALRQPAKFGRKFRSGGAGFNPRRSKIVESSNLRSSEATSQDEKFQAIRFANSIDEFMGFERFETGKTRTGWLINMHSTSIEDENVAGGRAGVEYYFLDDNGNNFKATVEYDPYVLIATKRGHEAEVEEWCRRVFEDTLKGTKVLEKEDLQMPNHLVGNKRRFIKLSFANVGNLLSVRKAILPIANKNQKNVTAMDTYAEMASANAGFDLFDEEFNDRPPNAFIDASEYIVDIREYDVPYHVRVSIDNDIRVGKWYNVNSNNGVISLSCIEDRLKRADPVVLAFDIETTKLPLKFPDAVIDQIMMMSYMIDGKGYLITNREIVSEDICDFEYTPKPEYQGPFEIFNEPNEKAVLERFFAHVKAAKPTVIATYNGDFFDWPFVEARASVQGIDMYAEIGFRKNSEDIYHSDYCVHMDCYAWVNRDSYLPQGSRGLKAVTVAKLGYDPDELDPEVMTRYASERPQTLAEYSVSDAVATYYLYMKYIHPFIFSLCTIVPLNPDDVLRKGTGTLCEMLLSVQAYKGNIILPNKHSDPIEAFWEGHLLESETYVGGHVESIEAGVFRSDIPVNFAVDPTAIDKLLSELDAALKFCITVEEKKKLEDVTNYEQVKQQITERLMNLKETPNRKERPTIYHLDVASMYPNIMTTNRLQPDSMIQESDCAACDFNRPGKTCDRRMPWAWRGEFLPAKRDEYSMIRRAVSNEKFPGKTPMAPSRAFEELTTEEQAKIIRKRLQEYSKKIYHKIHDSKTIEREAIICQRENPFYVNTVRAFRDRRYDFKAQQKVWKGNADALASSGAPAAEVDEAKEMIILFDSLQLAHKVILNSFYGYVMRKGSRWYSLEMAGVTCLTGARIIQMARELVERLGRPLELDTDGIWCMLPATFPENYAFVLANGKKVAVSYPCVMLNHLVHEKYTNHQYQTLVDPVNFRYETHSDNSIFFEVDGPYKAMILPTSKEEDKNLKKRYAVFNPDGSLAELKGFEVKRRGELKLIKIFQTQIFKFFLEGSTLVETYGVVAEVANRWLDVLYNHGTTLADEELIDLICENRSMTKSLDEYAGQKSTSITTARRLAEFLGDQMVKDKGLNCRYIIASKPRSAPVTDRAIPVTIFSAEYTVKRFFLRKWLKDDPGDMDPRSLLDWDYYLERLGSVIQKLITIPSGLQKIQNPVPRVPHPDWLQHRIDSREDRFRQKKMTDMFTKKPLSDLSTNIVDPRLPLSQEIEDIGNTLPQKPKQLTIQPAPPKRKAPEGASVTNIDPFASLPPVMPSMVEDYKGWLKYQKQKWKIQKEARLRRRKLFGERKQIQTGGIGTMFRQQAELIYVNTWQILELRETETPGVVRMFVLIDKNIHSLTVKVPRSILVNLKSDDPPDVDLAGCSVSKVNNVLPNGHPSVHLFRLEMPEDTYLRESEKVTVMFNHPSVEGVYERQVPLNIRAVLKLGTMCTFDDSQRGVLGKGLEQGFELSTLLKKSTTDQYLSSPLFEYVFLYHVVASDKQIFALFSSRKEEAHIVVYTKLRDVQGFPNADKIYAEALRRRLEEADGPWQQMFSYQEKLHFRTAQVTSRRKAHLEVNDMIKKFGNESSFPVLLVIQSPQCQTLNHELPVLKDHPILSLQSDASDNELPPLGWQSFVVKQIVMHYLALDSWLLHLMVLSRYGDIPLCNLDSDDPRFLIDITYARRLERNNVALWWSPSAMPDHAGYEKDNSLLQLEKVEMPSINNPGTYQSVCIEIDIRNLPVNTILTSSLINELEGSESMLNPSGPTDDGSGIFYSETAFSAVGIMVLRDMVKSWWADACDGNEMADVMVQHLIRWVQSSSSYLYDPALNHHVQMMSKKAFQQLMTDFRRVGSNIVFASSNRLLLQTTKGEIGNAYAYSQYILKSIKGKPLFSFMDLEIKEFWDYLVWYDEYNFGGKGCSQIVEVESQELETIMHWQLCRFLPKPLQPIFTDWIVEYIELMYSEKRSKTNGINGEPRATQLFFPSVTDVDSGQVTSILKDSFSKPLKKQIAQLIRRQRDELLHPELASTYEFPTLPGAFWGSTRELNPTLELVKYLMQVLSLCKTTALETRLLRRELLKLFDISEFSPVGRFENPSGSLKFSQLICDQCAMARDLDLCRDSDVLPEDGAEGNNMRLTQRPWLCVACGAEFDRLSLEERLIGDIQDMVVQWQIQDLRCARCGAIRVSEFSEHCKCSGEWTLTMDRAVVERRLRVYDSVGKFYGLAMVQDVASDVLRHM